MPGGPLQFSVVRALLESVVSTTGATVDDQLVAVGRSVNPKGGWWWWVVHRKAVVVVKLWMSALRFVSCS